MRKLTPLAYELGNALFKRHAEVCAPLKLSEKAVTKVIADECTIPYKALCESVGAVEMTESVGDFLNELAEWCQSRGLPPDQFSGRQWPDRVPWGWILPGSGLRGLGR